MFNGCNLFVQFLHSIGDFGEFCKTRQYTTRTHWEFFHKPDSPIASLCKTLPSFMTATFMTLADGNSKILPVSFKHLSKCSCIWLDPLENFFLFRSISDGYLYGAIEA